jgi:hypothetical protein
MGGCLSGESANFLYVRVAIPESEEEFYELTDLNMNRCLHCLRLTCNDTAKKLEYFDGVKVEINLSVNGKYERQTMEAVNGLTELIQRYKPVSSNYAKLKIY